jgi:small subunit ribosomal protein S16
MRTHGGTSATRIEEKSTTVAVKIKLARYGKIREPYYRVVVADSRTRRSGRAIETIGRYNPKADPSIIQIESERAQYWLGVGAQPTEAVVALLKVTGDWQSFKGLPGTEGTLKPQPERVDKRALYEAAIAAAGGSTEDSTGATTARKKAAPKKTDADSPKAPKAAGTDGAAAKSDEDAKTAKSDDKADEKAEEPHSLVDAPKADGEKADGEKADAAPFGEGSHAPIEGDAQPDGFPVKGNASSKLYHRPDTQFYDSTVAEVWFASAEAAEAAGFSLPKSQQGEE